MSSGVASEPEGSASVPKEGGPAGVPKLRVLFVGNSLTFWKPGLDAIFRLWGHDAAAVVAGGATLQVLWDAGKALHVIRSGRHDYVVLQDDLPEYGRGGGGTTFLKYAKLFVEAARENAATPVLLLTHSYVRLKHTSLDTIARAHQEAARELEVPVAPAGLIIGHEGSAAATKLGTLLSRDKEHPLPAGMLLEALVVHATISDAVGARGASSAPALEVLATRAIAAGALAGSAPQDADLARTLATAATQGRDWWRTFPAQP